MEKRYQVFVSSTFLDLQEERAAVVSAIAKSERPRSVKDKGTYWTITPYGDDHLTTLRAIHRAGPTTETEEAEASPQPA